MVPMLRVLTILAFRPAGSRRNDVMKNHHGRGRTEPMILIAPPMGPDYGLPAPNGGAAHDRAVSRFYEQHTYTSK